MIKGVKIIDKQFKKVEMEMQVRQNKKESKTECMYILVQAFFKVTSLQIYDKSDPTSQAIVKLPTASEIH